MAPSPARTDSPRLGTTMNEAPSSASAESVDGPAAEPLSNSAESVDGPAVGSLSDSSESVTGLAPDPLSDAAPRPPRGRPATVLQAARARASDDLFSGRAWSARG